MDMEQKYINLVVESVHSIDVLVDCLKNFAVFQIKTEINTDDNYIIKFFTFENPNHIIRNLTKFHVIEELHFFRIMEWNKNC